MRLIFQFICLFVSFVISSQAFCSEKLLAHYQISYQVDGDVKTIQVAPYVTSGSPIEYKMGEYNLTLIIFVNPAQSDEYTLKLSLEPSVSSKNAKLTITRSFKSRLSSPEAGPLEFKIAQDNVKVTGAMSLTLIKG